ncbi:hypothetical protein DFH94DRAFT_337772 [Russula ochroleuca]|uniref:Uncharacterized protein n=1 Tax=Russula ochroleuca TaxID=152965 RepID=A0A9P5N273_9AGAM|nr:hypothetical protein DFH94DRAFT_337772 [Russula ochroleuca]
MRDMFNSAPRASSVGNNTGLQEIEEDDYQDDYLAWAYPEAVQTTTRDRTPTGGEAGGNDNPWDGYTVSRLEPPTKINIKGGEKWICSEHGPLCNPGICQTRRALERDRQRQQERDDRLKAKEERMERGRKNAEKKERKGLDSSHEMPPHLAFRGAGGWGAGSGSGTSTSSGSGSEGEGDNPRNSGSPTGSGSRSPAPSPAPSAPPESVVGPDEWREQQGSSLWGEEDEEAPRVSLPTGTAWSGASSNRVGGGSGTTNYKNQSKNTKNNGNNISRGIAGASRQQPTSRSTAAPSGRGDATVPAGAQTSVWGRAPLARPEDPRGAASIHSVSGDAPAGAQSPAPKQLQSVWDTPSAASAVTTTSPIRNSRSTGPDSDVAPAPRSGQQNGRQRERGHSGSTGASSSTASEHRSAGGLAANTTISSPLSSAGPRSPSSASPSLTSPLGIFVPVEGGFPTYADTEWGDPIAMAVKAQPSKRKSKSTSGTPSTASPSAAGADTGDDNLESGRGQQQEATGSNAGTGRARAPRRGGRNARRRGAAAAAPARATQDVAPPREPDVTPPPGGPDEPWCNEDVEW